MHANKNKLYVRKFEELTSGSVNVNQVQFEFSEDWDGMARTAVFKQGNTAISVLLCEDAACYIPYEVLQEHGRALYAGVYGTKDGAVVLPTIWTSLGEVKEGVKLGEDARPPTPEIYEQVLNEVSNKADGMRYTEDGDLGLYAGDKLLESVPIQGGGQEEDSVVFGHGLKVSGNTVSVDAVNELNGDNTLPITAAAVNATVGNIAVLLGTI